MTTHVFIVDETTFHFHLEYMFAGTGANKSIPTFITNNSSAFSSFEEKTLTGMLADCLRVRKDDNVIFYLQAKGDKEGRFYGIFKVDSDPFLDLGGNTQYLYTDGLSKYLPFRVKIRPWKVYPRGVTEWTALDEIDGISSPSKMIWSLIYRKLRGNRGNTMITLYEAERLLTLIQVENKSTPLSSQYFTFNLNQREIVAGGSHNYSGNCTQIDILPRLIHRFISKKSHEAHLQSYISGNLEKNDSLLSSLQLSKESIEWIGNEVSCGVGMQKIDIVVSAHIDENERRLYIIELKDEHSSEINFVQIRKYVKWVMQYYYQNTPCIIQPVLISLKPLKKRTANKLSNISKERLLFDSESPRECRPIMLLEYSIVNNNIEFHLLP